MSLYSPSERPPNPMNRLANMNDGSGTINPAALTGNVVLPPTSIDSSSRGVKRSRSPDGYGEYLQGGDDNDESKPRKRGRPSKTPRTSGDFSNEQIGSLPTPLSQTSPEVTQTPHVKSQSQQVQILGTQNQTSPNPKQTPTKPTLKALPTVRDHTSDQLNPEADEYIPREYDDAGEGKVDVNGYLQGGREYKIKTFTLPGRAEKLFMLATECARTLQYRDSYLLFNKNRSLFKIIAQPKEKEELVTRDILPYSYRSRQIAIVTARSMFRQFGSRVIKDGRRVRDDYWEAKARKQGFTEEDAAGEKRPGAARAREAALAEAQAGRTMLTSYGDIVYSNGPAFGNIQPPPLQPGITNAVPLPTIDAYDTSKFRDIARPRQELNGPPYSDLTRTSNEAEMASQSGHAADYSKNINAQGRYRRNIVEEYWHRPHDPPVSTPQPQTVEPSTTQAFTSPRFNSNDLGSQPSSILSQQQTPQNTMNPPNFSHQQSQLQSPVRQTSVSQNFGRDSSQFTPQHQQFNRSSSNLSLTQTPGGQPSLGYGGAAFSPQTMNQQHQQQSWGGPPQPPHQSPGLQRMPTPQFSPSLGHGQIPSPMSGGQHPHQSPHPQQMQPPQMSMLQHPSSLGGHGGQQLFGPGGGLQAMSAAGFGNLGMAGQRGMYGVAGQGGASQFMQPQAGGQQQQQQQSQPQSQQQTQSWGAPHGQGWGQGLQ